MSCDGASTSLSVRPTLFCIPLNIKASWWCVGGGEECAHREPRHMYKLASVASHMGTAEESMLVTSWVQRIFFAWSSRAHRRPLMSSPGSINAQPTLPIISADNLVRFNA